MDSNQVKPEDVSRILNECFSILEHHGFILHPNHVSATSVLKAFEGFDAQEILNVYFPGCNVFGRIGSSKIDMIDLFYDVSKIIDDCNGDMEKSKLVAYRAANFVSECIVRKHMKAIVG